MPASFSHLRALSPFLSHGPLVMFPLPGVMLFWQLSLLPNTYLYIWSQFELVHATRGTNNLEILLAVTGGMVLLASSR